MSIHGVDARSCLGSVSCGGVCPGRPSRSGADGESLRAGGSVVSPVRRGDWSGGSGEAEAAVRSGATSAALYVVRCTFWTLRSSYHQVLPGFWVAVAGVTGWYAVPGDGHSDGW